MGLRISTNVQSINAQRHLKDTTRRLGANFESLASGYRINRASDDAAGLAISEKMKARLKSTSQARRNANDGISLLQTAEGGLNEISSMLIRLRELAIQSSNDTLVTEDRAYADQEFQALKLEIERIANNNEFNGRKLLNGTSGLLEFQISVGNDPFIDRISFDTTGTSTTLEALGVASETVATKETAQLSLSALDSAIKKVSGVRADIGALQNRLQKTINNLAVSEENLAAANSRIRDVDIAS